MPAKPTTSMTDSASSQIHSQNTLSYDPADRVKNQLLFTESSQFRHWLFPNQESLNRVRQETNYTAIQRAKQAWIIEQKESELAGIKLDSIPTKDEDFLTAQNELDLCRFFEGKIMDYCTSFGFDRTVQATAIIFFKRFFLKHSVLEHDYKLILMASLFLATKVENTPIGLEEFLSKIPKSPPASKIIELEFIVSQGINFDFKVHTAYWPLHGLFLDIQAYLQQQSRLESNTTSSYKFTDQLKDLFRAYTKATDLLTTALLTDLIFLYLPSQLAFAAFLFVAQEESSELEDIFESYMSTRFQEERIDLVVELKTKLGEIITHMNDLGLGEGKNNTAKKTSTVTVDKTVASQAAHRLRSCFNPEWDAKKLAYKRRIEKEEEQERQKREEKQLKEKQAAKDLAAIVS